jgi:hypothetical protein
VVTRCFASSRIPRRMDQKSTSKLARSCDQKAGDAG